MKATVFVQKCGRTGKLFGVRVQQMEDGDWYRTWAFPIDEQRANREGYQNTHIENSWLPAAEGYPGCPYCGSRDFFLDPVCRKFSCSHGGDVVTCPWCSGTYNVVPATEKFTFDLSGGDI